MIFGTKVGKLLRCHPNWRNAPTQRRAITRLSLVTGGKARRTLPPHGVSSALCSPFGKVVSAALAPAGSSLGKTQTLAYFSASVVCCFELGASICPNIIACQAGKCTFSAFHKRGTPHGGFISYLNTKRRKALENSGITHTLHSQNGGIY